MGMDFEFSKLKNRCCLCGGELSDYDKQFNYTDHTQRSTCVEVLQNTLKGLSKNEKINSNMIAILSQYVTDEQFNSASIEASNNGEIS